MNRLLQPCGYFRVRQSGNSNSRHRVIITAVFLAIHLVTNVALALEPATKLTQYAHRAWRFGDAGLLGTPQSIAQTSDGYIWVSTGNGLFRFDGMRFSKWDPPAGERLPSNSMWHLFGARNGSLYVGTDLGLARITDGHVYTYAGSPRWPGPFVEDGDGNVWMGISGSQSEPEALCKIGESSLNCLGSRDGFLCARGISNTIDDNGYFWIGSTEGICRWKPGGKPQSNILPYLSHQPEQSAIHSLAADSDGTMWAGTPLRGEGLGLLHLEKGKWRSYVTPLVDGRNLSVSSLHTARDGSLWIGTCDQGIFRLSKGRLEQFDTENGLSAHNVLSMFQDREGGVWVVTPMGVDYFRDFAVLSFSANDGYYDARAITVTTNRRGTVFLGSSTLSVLHDQTLTHFRDQNGHLITDIQFLFTDSQDNIWIGTKGRLLRLKNEHTINEVSGFPTFDTEDVAYITEDRNRDIWVAGEDSRTRRSSLFRIRNDRVAGKYEVTSDFGKQEINALAPNPEGGLWVGGSAHGLFWFHEDRFEQISIEGFHDRVENIMEEASGVLWLVTPHGFIRYSNGNARKLTTIDGLPCDSGVNIQDDGAGAKWFYLHCGIARVFDKDIAEWWNGSTSSIPATSFTALDGARPNLANGNPTQTPDGHLWSASDYIFQIIDRHHLPFNALPPPVKVESFAADGRELMPSNNLILPAFTRQIEIGYAGLSYLIPELVRFRYRLQGYDAKWIEAGGRRHAFYNDLRPGRYVFHVSACNNSGVWNNDGTEIAFTIPAAWYQTQLFHISASLLAFLIITVVYLYRLRSYTRSLKLRFDERLAERTRLARDLHDTLLQTIQGSKMVADAARAQADDWHATIRALDRLSDWLDRASFEGRAALESLRTSTFDTTDLVGALRLAVDDCTREYKIKVNISTSGTNRDLHPIARDEVYRIGYEAIRNACSHSGTQELWVDLEYKRKFRLEIRDNGKGIDEGILRVGKPGHFGLTGMRERASHLGGELRISSSPRTGTTISLIVPGHAIYKSSLEGFRARWKKFFLGSNDMRD